MSKYTKYAKKSTTRKVYEATYSAMRCFNSKHNGSPLPVSQTDPRGKQRLMRDTCSATIMLNYKTHGAIARAANKSFLDSSAPGKKA